jgi:hypothetical protein
MKDGHTMVSHCSRTPRPAVLSRTVAIATTLSPVAVLSAAVAFLDPGVQLEQGLSVAAATEARLMAEAAPARPTAVAARAYEEGSEGFWLLRAPSDSSVKRVSWQAPVAPGDRIVLGTGSAGEILDVLAVEEERPETTRIDTGEQKPVRYSVTGRRIMAPGSAPVRVIVDASGQGVTRISRAADRAL